MSQNAKHWQVGCGLLPLSRTRNQLSLACGSINTMKRSWDQYAHRLCAGAGYEYRLSFSTMGRFSLRSYRESVPHENGVICIFIELLHLMPISLDLWTVWYLNSSGASQPPVWVTCKYNKNNAARDLVNHIYTMTGFGPTRSGERLPVGGTIKTTSRGFRSAADTAWQKLKKLIWQTDYDANISLWRWRSTWSGGRLHKASDLF